MTAKVEFYDLKHEQLYNSLYRRMRYADVYHQTAAYLLALDAVVREHAEDLFDIDGDMIKPEGLYRAWQTGTSRKTTRLLFNLWNGYNSDREPPEEEARPRDYTPEDIFSCTYAPYYWQAVQIRFPEYTTA